MLVLQRKRDERNVLVENETDAIIATILVSRFTESGHAVRLGIEADRQEIGIYRDEVWERMKAAEEPVVFTPDAFVMSDDGPTAA